MNKRTTNIRRFFPGGCTTERRGERVVNPAEFTHHIDASIEQKSVLILKMVRIDGEDSKYIEETIIRVPINKATGADETFVDVLQTVTRLNK